METGEGAGRLDFEAADAVSTRSDRSQPRGPMDAHAAHGGSFVNAYAKRATRAYSERVETTSLSSRSRASLWA